jgi:hypothetical protein
MKISQIATLVNDVTKEVLGESALQTENLDNIVDIGKQVLASDETVDAYVKSLINHIGKVVFVNREYKGSAPSVMMDSWEFGSVLEKIRADIPEAKENDSWNLIDGQSYDPNIFYQPKVTAKFYNSKTTFEIDMSFTRKQVQQSFSSATQLNSFLSMLETQVYNSLTIKDDAMIMRTINNMSALTIYDAYKGSPTSTSSYTRAVNLLRLYNMQKGTSLSAVQAIKDKDFLKFASYTLLLYADRMHTASRLFNIGGKMSFTPNENMHIVLLSEFKRAADIYLESETFHNEFVKLPSAESVPYWQGSGTDYDFSSTSKINVQISDLDNTDMTRTVECDGILGVMFDRWSLGVANINKRVTSNYNPRAEFYTNFYKGETSFFNDVNENFVVFFVA